MRPETVISEYNWIVFMFFCGGRGIYVYHSPRKACLYCNCLLFLCHNEVSPIWGWGNVNNMRRPTHLWSSSSTRSVFFASWLWTEIACTIVATANTSVMLASLESCHGAKLTLSHHSASFVMSGLISSSVYFNLLFLYPATYWNIIGSVYKWVRWEQTGLP